MIMDLIKKKTNLSENAVFSVSAVRIAGVFRFIHWENKHKSQKHQRFLPSEISERFSKHFQIKKMILDKEEVDG